MPGWAFAASLKDFDIEVVKILSTGAMMTDGARNNIARRHLETDVDWLYWIDDDNVNRAEDLAKLLDHDEMLIGGLYYNRRSKEPVCYMRRENGQYAPISNFKKGEIISADAGGMNGLLTHRKLYEDIDDNYVALNRANGGVMVLHIDDVDGSPHPELTDDTDGRVVDGQYRERVWPSDSDVPFFQLEYSRTEDMGFFERAKRLGYEYKVDTSIEAPHLIQTDHVDGKDHRRMRYENLLPR